MEVPIEPGFGFCVGELKHVTGAASDNPYPSKIGMLNLASKFSSTLIGSGAPPEMANRKLETLEGSPS